MDPLIDRMVVVLKRLHEDGGFDYYEPELLTEVDDILKEVTKRNIAEAHATLQNDTPPRNVSLSG